jgi:hypothetical protein
MSAPSSTLLDSSLPTGGWTLYFHPAKETRWHMDTYKVVATVKTFRELAELFATVTAQDWTRGKFFFTCEGIPPLMENARNIRGGAYSLRVDRASAGEIMQKYIVAAVLGRLTTGSDNKIHCVRITPRRDFNILQIWNTDCTKHNSPDGLESLDARIPKGEVMYKPHVEKKI